MVKKTSSVDIHVELYEKLDDLADEYGIHPRMDARTAGRRLPGGTDYRVAFKREETNKS